MLGLTPLVLPITRCQERDVYTPDDHRTAGFDRLGGVNQIAPNDVPARMIVVGLYGPRPRAALRLQCFLRRGIESSTERQVRESLLRHVWVLVLLIWTDGV